MIHRPARSANTEGVSIRTIYMNGVSPLFTCGKSGVESSPLPVEFLIRQIIELGMRSEK